jgi:hypothetical protein
MTDEPQNPDTNNVLPFRKREEMGQEYHENLTQFRGQIFELLREGMQQKFAIMDFAQALIDGATYVALMANVEKDETITERGTRNILAQAQLSLANLQTVCSESELLELESVN